MNGSRQWTVSLIFFEDVLAADDAFFDKALEGLAMIALNQGEVCTCPSRAPIQESIHDRFMERAIERVEMVKQGNPLDPQAMIGAQASSERFEKILSYPDIGSALRPERCDQLGDDRGRDFGRAHRADRQTRGAVDARRPILRDPRGMQAFEPGRVGAAAAE